MLSLSSTVLYSLLLLYIGATSSSSASLCPHVVGQGHLQDTGGLEVYLDTADDALQQVSVLLRLLADQADGRIRLIRSDGTVDPFFDSPDDRGFAIPVSSVQQTPVHIITSRQLYYSFSVISPDNNIIETFSNVTPNSGILNPGVIANTTVEFCCTGAGSVALQGCLTVGTKPFSELGGDYVTLGPFYARYECSNTDVRTNCQSPPLFIVISEYCFQRNFTESLVEAGEGSWGLLISGFISVYCSIDVSENGVIEILRNPATNPNFPIGRNFTGLYLLFQRNNIPRWTGPVGYSMEYVSMNETIVNNPINATIPLQGKFENNQNFYVDLPCQSFGVDIVNITVNFSCIMDGIIFNNSFSLFFHRNCTPVDLIVDEATTTVPTVDTSAPLFIILPSSLIPVVLIITIVISIAVILLAISRKEKRKVQQLEELAQERFNLATSSNLYSINTSSHFEFLEGRDLEYNFASLEVVDKLGEGCFGHVYRAKAPGLTREFVAVKTLKDDCDAESRRQFIKEVQVCLQFDDPNVIKLLAVCTRSIQKCMIFEYMDLGSLNELLCKSSPLSPDYNPTDPHLLTLDRFLDISRQLASGLVHLATLNFVHRDIAARNCLMDRKFTAKIADFGLSRNISAQNYYRIGNGKNYLPIRWMPPEALFFGRFTLQSDVWSFGILMWEIYTYGTLPFVGLSNHEVIDNIKASKVLEKPEHCPLGVYDIMHSCWVRIPSKRPTIDRVLQRLELYASGKVDRTADYVNLMPDHATSSADGLSLNLSSEQSPAIDTGYAQLSPTNVSPTSTSQLLPTEVIIFDDNETENN